MSPPFHWSLSVFFIVLFLESLPVDLVGLAEPVDVLEVDATEGVRYLFQGLASEGAGYDGVVPADFIDLLALALLGGPPADAEDLEPAVDAGLGVAELLASSPQGVTLFVHLVQVGTHLDESDRGGVEHLVPAEGDGPAHRASVALEGDQRGLDDGLVEVAHRTWTSR